LSQYTRVTDIQTDGQTDRILIAIPRLHYMQRGIKWLKIHRYILRVKCSPKNLVFSGILLMAIFAGDHPQQGR